ncbi:hypothetical protein D3C75_1082190 [compost metagenome]
MSAGVDVDTGAGIGVGTGVGTGVGVTTGPVVGLPPSPPEGAFGVTAFDIAEAVLLPALLIAFTVNV